MEEPELEESSEVMSQLLHSICHVPAGPVSLVNNLVVYKMLLHGSGLQLLLVCLGTVCHRIPH